MGAAHTLSKFAGRCVQYAPPTSLEKQLGFVSHVSRAGLHSKAEASDQMRYENETDVAIKAVSRVVYSKLQLMGISRSQYEATA
jgi:hypothetical protein